jgi:hypothetical protein
MKKSILFVLVVLALGFNPALADGKANVKVGPVKVVADSNKEDSVTITKSTSLFNVSVSASRIVISSNPSTTNLALVLSFTTDEEDFVRGQTYDLGIADSLTTNAVILASYTRGSKGGGVLTTAASKATGTLKVTSYDAETGRLKGTINAKLFPAEINSVSSGTKAATKPVPISIKLDAILE